MTSGPDDERAAGSLEEATAALGAALSTGEPQGATERHLRDMQALLETAALSVLDGEPRAARLTADLERLRPSGPVHAQTRGLRYPTHSLAAGLTRLARTIVQRARREVLAIEGASEVVVAVLSELPTILDQVAADLDVAEERSVPIGVCAR